ncbi:MAG: phospholipase D family protein [Gammaproteobacteria bacterium]
MNRKVLALGVLALCLGALLLLRACGTLPPLENRSTSTAIVDTGDTRLGLAVAPMVEANPETSGIYALQEARDAFAARWLLAAAADRSLDAQYYIWRKDTTGTLLFEALRVAADRGVRVRLLLDDNNTSGLDSTLAALDSHANIEVRLFNPFVIRNPRAINFLIDFFRVNRRMHNKSFTADNQATIIGGRNVGDEYFGATDGVLFADLDVLAIGPVVEDVSEDFDRYWASESSYPVDRLLPAADPERLAELSAAASQIERDSAAAEYMNAVRNSEFVRELIEGTVELTWAPTRMVSDDPAKGLGRAPPETQLPSKLREIIGEPQAELDLVSPYFVPTAAGVDWFVDMAERGVQIRVLVNALEATDVDAVHSGYAKRREPLLEAGISLYEVRLSSPGSEGKSPRAGPMGSSGTSLHAKTFSVDRSRVFIGSFNFDPRSINLNTEMGFVIYSPALAEGIDAVLDRRIPQSTYAVKLSESGELYWTEQRDGKLVRYDEEPGTTFWQRAAVQFMSVLPIEWLL